MPESAYAITSRGRQAMERLGVSTPEDLIAISALCCEILDRNPELNDDHAAVMNSIGDLVEHGYLRWDAEHHGFRFTAPGEDDDFGFLPGPVVTPEDLAECA
jgi:hypothetical protein